MQGRILEYNFSRRAGVISGADGQHYPFDIQAWRDSSPPAPGLEVDFMASSGRATSVYRYSGSAAAGVARKSKGTAAVLAFFLGGFGVHKFYLGYPGAGLTMLLVTVLSLGILGILVIAPIAFIEFIIYLAKSEEDFHKTYVVGSRSWF